MKLKSQFVTHEVGDSSVMVSVGEGSFNGLVRSNKTAAEIIELLKSDTTKEAIVESMFSKYEVSEEVLTNDVERILSKLKELDAIED